MFQLGLCISFFLLVSFVIVVLVSLAVFVGSVFHTIVHVAVL